MPLAPVQAFNPIALVTQQLALEGMNLQKVNLRSYNQEAAASLLQLSSLDDRLDWVAASANAIVKLHVAEDAKRAAMLELLESETVAGLVEVIAGDGFWQSQADRVGRLLQSKVGGKLGNAEAAMATVVDGVLSWDEAAVQASLAGVVNAGGLGELFLAMERSFGGFSDTAYTKARRVLYRLQDRFARYYDELARLSPEERRHHVDSFVTAGRVGAETDTELELIGSAALQRIARLVAPPRPADPEAEGATALAFPRDEEAGSLTNLILGRKEPRIKRSASTRNNRNVINVLAASMIHRPGTRFKVVLLSGEDLPGRNPLYDERSHFTFDAASSPTSFSTLDMWQKLGVFGEDEEPASLQAMLVPSLIEFATNALEQGNRDRANELIGGAMKVYPDVPALHILAARADPEQAERHLLGALVLNPRDFVARAELYTIYKRQKRREEALKVGRAADKTAARNLAAIQKQVANWGVPPTRAQLRELRMELTWLSNQQGDPDGAERHYQEARALDPNDMVTEEELKELLIAGDRKVAHLDREPTGEELLPVEFDAETAWSEAINEGKKSTVSDEPIGKEKKVLAGDLLQTVYYLQEHAPEEVMQALNRDLARIEGPDAALARAIYLKAASARYQALLSHEAYGPHRTDAAVRMRNDALATLRVFSGRLNGQKRSELLRRNLVIDLGQKRSRKRGKDPWDTDIATPGLYAGGRIGKRPRGAEGVAQRHRGSCGPTTLQIPQCNRDPVRAWIVHDAGHASFSATDAVGRFQAHILLDYGSAPLSRIAFMNWKRVRYGLGLLKRQRKIRKADAQALRDYIGTGEPGAPISAEAARALRKLRELADGFPSNEVLREIQADPLKGEEGLLVEEFQSALNQYLSPVTGYRYRLIHNPAEGGGEDDPPVPFKKAEAKRWLRRAATFLRKDVAVVFSTSEPAHYMVMTGVTTEKGQRKYLVTDPMGGMTQEFTEEQMASGRFLGKLFGLSRREQGRIDAFYLPEKIRVRNGRRKEATA